MITAFPHAVSRVNGSASFACAREHTLSSICDDPTAEHLVSVQTVSLDSVLQGAKVAGMKLDTEGHELSSLEGAARTIEECSPWMIVEFNTMLLASPVLADWPVYRFMKTLGYKPFVYGRSDGPKEIADSFSLRGYCNILFLKVQRPVTV